MPNFQINVEAITRGFQYDKIKIRKIAKTILSDSNVTTASLNIILVNDSFMKKMNVEYLHRNTTTDVLSFVLEQDEKKKSLEGEIYANLEQIDRQSRAYKTTWSEELLRVVIHGILHLVGSDDQSPPEKKEMTEKENYYLIIASS